MLIISDSHVSEFYNNYEDFFAMLDKVAGTGHDVVFLGDIFDLWFGFDRYESDLHKRFLDWCAQEKANRKIGFIEGNHEFFVVDNHQNEFSWGAVELQVEDKIAYLHGDRILGDWGHALLQFILKGCLTGIFCKYVPFGPKLADLIKGVFDHRKKNKDRSSWIWPEERVQQWLTDNRPRLAPVVLAGHFHRGYFVEKIDGCEIHFLPEWQNSGMVTLLEMDADTPSVTCANWREILGE